MRPKNGEIIDSKFEILSKGHKGFPFKFCYAVRNIPHIEKREKGGEDAWSASPNLLAVADGVGGWAAYNVDPGLFSK